MPTKLDLAAWTHQSLMARMRCSCANFWKASMHISVDVLLFVLHRLCCLGPAFGCSWQAMVQCNPGPRDLPDQCQSWALLSRMQMPSLLGDMIAHKQLDWKGFAQEGLSQIYTRHEILQKQDTWFR